ncbi:hypothetical protein [Haloarcula salina]|uniref:Uncharacterized protein n=1 Tax=Haloarcula salina TaxID=1429914 RepID=A0AA41G1G3_9EURY|nr:hypothetical protein [Haloarcula salina]MBV0901849.1 hypothetical protein [Haloarcula salina]
MTGTYEQLQQCPQTGISRSDLNFEERSEVRAIQVKGTSGLSQTNNPGKFTDVFYLDGEEKAAAETFAAENAALLEQLDLSARNVLQTSLARELYDLILDASGRRDIERYPTVVVETHEDGTQWVINRDRYETRVDRRYTTSETGSARIPGETSLHDIYESLGDTITEANLRNTTIAGDVRQVLDYYRVSSTFECVPVTTDDQQLAVRKRTQATQS